MIWESLRLNLRGLSGRICYGTLDTEAPLGSSNNLDMCMPWWS